jgi:1-acyl-sn-glycerol-3-phosphate acyltransferase
MASRATQDAHTPAVPAQRQVPRTPLLRRIVKAILRLYLVPVHHVRLEDGHNLPATGPALILLNHASLLDVPVLMLLDPFPDTATVVKSSMFKLPLIGWVLRHWGAIPVDREGRDTSSVRSMLGVLRAGRPLAVAAEGRRTRRGHLEGINPVLARMAAGSGVPLIPVGIRGSYQALPPGALLPRPVPIVVKVGRPFTLDRTTDAETAARRIRDEIAALLPPDLQPVD